MDRTKATEMIDEYLLEPNSIAKDWIECLRLCKQALLDKEALIKEQETLQKHLAEKQAEIERLHAEGLQLNRIFMDFVNKQKAEAIKEFAERLKAEYIFWKLEDGSLRKIIPIYAIDYLVKEMVGTKANTSVSLVDGHIESDKAFWEDTH